MYDQDKQQLRNKSNLGLKRKKKSETNKQTKQSKREKDEKEIKRPTDQRSYQFDRKL